MILALGSDVPNACSNNLSCSNNLLRLFEHALGTNLDCVLCVKTPKTQCGFCVDIDSNKYRPYFSQLVGTIIMIPPQHLPGCIN